MLWLWEPIDTLDNALPILLLCLWMSKRHSDRDVASPGIPPSGLQLASAERMSKGTLDPSRKMVFGGRGIVPMLCDTVLRSSSD